MLRAGVIGADQLQLRRRRVVSLTGNIRTSLRPEGRSLLDLQLLGYGLGVLGFALVLLALGRGHAVIAMALACLMAMMVTAISHPALYRRGAFVGLFVLPFVAAFEVFRPADINTPFYFSVLVLALVALGLFQWRPLPRTLGMAYVGYILLAAVFYFVWRADWAGISGAMYVAMAFGMYVLVRRSTRADRRLLFAIILAFGCVEALIGTLQSVVGWPIFPPCWGRSTSCRAATGRT